MWTRIGQIVSVILAFAVIAGAIYGLYELVRGAISVYTALDKTVEAAIIAASATVLGSAITITVGKIYESQIHIQKTNREKRIPVYEDLLKFMFGYFDSASSDKPVPDEEVQKFMSTFNQRFVVWGSDSVIAAWVRWRRHLMDPAAVQAKPHENLFLYEDLIFAIRTDLGYKNKNLTSGDVLSLWVNDVQQILPRIK